MSITRFVVILCLVVLFVELVRIYCKSCKVQAEFIRECWSQTSPEDRRRWFPVIIILVVITVVIRVYVLD